MADSSSDKGLSASLIDDFIAFLNECWTAYHTTAEARRRLLAAGFVELDETQQKHDVKVGGYIPIVFSLFSRGFSVFFLLILFNFFSLFLSRFLLLENAITV